jgi:hypothetical protein
MSWFGDVVSDLMGLENGAGASDAQGAIDVESMANVLAAIWADLTDGKMWRSLGWLLAGLVLMITGIWLWIGHPLPSVVPVPV